MTTIYLWLVLLVCGAFLIGGIQIVADQGRARMADVVVITALVFIVVRSAWELLA